MVAASTIEQWSATAFSQMTSYRDSRNAGESFLESVSFRNKSDSKMTARQPVRQGAAPTSFVHTGDKGKSLFLASLSWVYKPATLAFAASLKFFATAAPRHGVYLPLQAARNSSGTSPSITVFSISLMVSEPDPDIIPHPSPLA